LLADRLILPPSAAPCCGCCSAGTRLPFLLATLATLSLRIRMLRGVLAPLLRPLPPSPCEAALRTLRLCMRACLPL
jgi:hypothetical protein